ncbi:TPA: arginase [Vibrio vulnificus]|nr:arginase [Vibrio vulnificus]
MLSLFKRHRLAPANAYQAPMFYFMSVCQYVKPMSVLEFETAQQILSNASDWLYQQQSAAPLTEANHFVLDGHTNSAFQRALNHSLALGLIPTVFANGHEMLLNSLPALAQDNTSVGVVHIGHSFELKQTLDLQVGSAFHFLLSRYPQAKLFCIGIDTEQVSTQTLDYAEDLGCDWVGWDECGFLSRNQLKAQLSGFIQHCDQIVINVDLASLVPGNGLETHKLIDSQIVLRVLRQIVVSKKICSIQLVGSTDKIIYSRQTKEIIDELIGLSPFLEQLP